MVKENNLIQDIGEEDSSNNDQINPMLRTLMVIGDKWNILILSMLLNKGEKSFQDLVNGFPDLTPNSLTNKLEKLQEFGIIKLSRTKGSTSYNLTKSGVSLKPLLSEMKDWGRKTQVNVGKSSIDKKVYGKVKIR